MMDTVSVWTTEIQLLAFFNHLSFPVEACNDTQYDFVTFAIDRRLFVRVERVVEEK